MEGWFVKNEQDVKIRVHPHITVSDNYLRLTNKPKINGIELVGNLSSDSLNILSNNLSGYDEITIGAAVNQGSFLLTITPENEVKKVELGKLTEGRFSTTTDVSEVQVGNYIFKEREK